MGIELVLKTSHMQVAGLQTDEEFFHVAVSKTVDRNPFHPAFQLMTSRPAEMSSVKLTGHSPLFAS